MSLRMGSHHNSMSRANTLDKRVPRNPRYAGIQSKVKTGMTVDKLTFVTTRQHLRRQEEPYFRLTPSQLSELLNEYEQDRQEGVQDFRDHIDPDNHGPRVVEHEPDAMPCYERPYLILDVRAPEHFRRCRITQARSFEGKLLNQDRMTPELYTYKNKEGGLVVLYSNDEKEACHAATILIHRGFDNVFVLSGGIIAFARIFSSYVEGDTDALLLSIVLSGSGSSSGRSSATGTARSQRCSTDGIAMGAMSTHSSNNGTNSGSGVIYGTRSSVNGSTYKNSSADRREGGERSRNSIGRRSGRLDYRGGHDGQSVIVRGGFSSSCLSYSGDGGRVRPREGGIIPQGGSRGDATAGSEKRQPPSYMQSEKSAHYPRSNVDMDDDVRRGDNGGGGALREPKKHDRVFSVSDSGSSRAVARGREGLAEAAAAASAARRRSVGRGGGVGEGGEGDVSRGSTATVADSVISRATARRGRW